MNALAVACPWCHARPGAPCTERIASLWRWGAALTRPVRPHRRRERLAADQPPAPETP